jgi:hypothetical protein
MAASLGPSYQQLGVLLLLLQRSWGDGNQLQVEMWPEVGGLLGLLLYGRHCSDGLLLTTPRKLLHLLLPVLRVRIC